MGGGWTVLWTRGESCAAVADVLSTGTAQRVEGDLRAACIHARADLLVSSTMSSFDLVPTIAPDVVDLDTVGSVVAAVAGGPHTDLATRVAQRMASSLGVSGCVVSVSQDDETDRQARAMLDQVGSVAPDLERWLLRANSASAVVDELEPDTLLVLGAPGGSWLQRQFFGPGKRLRKAAPNGVVVVRDAPMRCFHGAVDEAVALGTELAVVDALRVVQEPAAPVVDGGRLIGMASRRALEDADAGATVGEIMGDPVFVYIDDPLADVEELAAFLDRAPVPVVDRDGRLLGSISGE